MEWLTLVTLADGSEVQSRMGSPRNREVDLHHYRIRHEDGSVQEFSTMLEVTRHLHDRHGLDRIVACERTASLLANEKYRPGPRKRGR
jgi:hypothetical protein